jgi:Ca2+-binding EF-hand superfamily protein
MMFAFAMFDQNKDGALSFEEVNVVPYRLSGFNSETEKEQKFREGIFLLDKNGNGKVEEEEFLARFSPEQGEKLQQSAEQNGKSSKMCQEKSGNCR